jgi:hypothetical protein
MKRIDFEKGSFEADGRTFYLRDSLTIERFMAFEELQTSVGLNLNFKEVFEKIKTAYEYFNGGKFADGSVVLHNLMSGVAERVDTKIHPALEICALFIVEKDEDVSTWDRAIMKSKVNAWKKEGYDMQDFFSLAVSLVQGFTEIYEDFTQNISKLAAEVEKKAKDIGNTN